MRSTLSPKLHLLAAACLAATLSLPAIAADASLARATDLMQRRDPAAAYELLAAEEPARAGQPDFDYLLGIAALDAGHVTRAIFALERVVAVQPANALAHAELARAYLAAGEGESARAELQQARRADIPKEAAAALDRVLGAIDQVMPSYAPRWAAYVELGAGHDSNVNSANNAGEFAIPAFGGLLFTVAPNSRRRGDDFAAAAAGVNVQLPLNANWKLIAAANGRSVMNHRVHEMNTSVVDGTLGLSHSGGAYTQTLALQSNGAWVSGSVYRSATGASAQWQTQLGAASQWSAFAQWSRQEYAGQAGRNTDRSVLGTAFAHAFAATGTLAYASLYAADEHARHAGFEYFGHHAIGGRLGAEQRLAEPLTLFAEWQRERRRYGGTEPLFDMQRRDHQTDLLAGVRWTPAATWSLTGSVRRTQARSDVLLYDYGRTVLQVGLRKEFP